MSGEWSEGRAGDSALDAPGKREAQVRELVPIAKAAWRVRTVLNLNLLPLLNAEPGEAAKKNLVDAINDLNEVLPSSEDGYPWDRWIARPTTAERK